MAQIATGNSDDALDIVQDAMLKLVEKYADKPADEWRYLFFKIVQSRITDWHRRSKVRTIISKVVSPFEPATGKVDLAEAHSGRSSEQPEEVLRTGQQIAALELALQRLPMRQQQAFLLRVWEGFDVRETAAAMSCSEGSVKTHYSRAIHTLRDQLDAI